MEIHPSTFTSPLIYNQGLLEEVEKDFEGVVIACNDDEETKTRVWVWFAVSSEKKLISTNVLYTENENQRKNRLKVVVIKYMITKWHKCIIVSFQFQVETPPQNMSNSPSLEINSKRTMKGGISEHISNLRLYKKCWMYYNVKHTLTIALKNWRTEKGLR